MGSDAPVRIDVPCDVQQIDDTGLVWTFLHEVGDPSLITEGAIVIVAAELDPVVARVVDLVARCDRTIVHLEVPDDPLEYADAVRRAHLLTA